LQGKELQVAKRRRRFWRFPDEFRAAAIQRVKDGETIAAVARDLDVQKRQVYAWIYKAERAADGSDAPDNSSALGRRWQNRQAAQYGGRPSPGPSGTEAVLQENRQLKQALADKSLEVDFFKGALQKIAARRQGNGKPGETTSTPKSRK
jgi:transposase-like protein